MSENPTPAPNAGFIKVNIEVNADTGVASAVLSPADTQGTLDHVAVLQLIETHEIADWLIDESAAEDLLKKFKKNKPCRVILAERKDAAFKLDISDDHMLATVDYTPAFGGENFTQESILKALADSKIDQKRIDTQAIGKMLLLTTGEKVVVAKGKPPNIGRDSFFSPILSIEEDSDTPIEDDNGQVDFLAGKTYLTIQAGSPLLERIPPQPGKMGMDIFGQLIPAPSGKEIPFGKDLEGTEFSKTDPNLLIAKVSGHPVIFEDGARVDKTLKFENIDLSTGHIKFDGSIEVSGDILPDMKVDVTGDIFVKGVIEKADVHAGNNIIVKGGIFGDTQIEVEEDTPPQFACEVSAKGDIQARFVNLAKITAAHSIDLREYSFNAELDAGVTIKLGQDGGKGNLVGGIAHAGISVVAKSLGNEAFNRTDVHVGLAENEAVVRKKLIFIRDQRLGHARNLKKVLNEIKEHSTQVKLEPIDMKRAKKIHDTLLHLQDDLRSIDHRLKKIELSILKKNHILIGATSNCYPNCILMINGASFKTKQEHKAITFVERGRRITAKK
jgi:uncharacterized protein (DUF342 family)